MNGFTNLSFDLQWKCQLEKEKIWLCVEKISFLTRRKPPKQLQMSNKQAFLNAPFHEETEFTSRARAFLPSSTNLNVPFSVHIGVVSLN